MKTKNDKTDKILDIGRSPLDDDAYWEQGNLDGEIISEDEAELSMDEETMRISGEMEIGSGGHPVTIRVTDELTGKEIEMNHVKNALLVIEDKRKSNSGWMSLLIGDVRKVGDVVRFIAQATLEELKKLTRRK